MKVHLRLGRRRMGLRHVSQLKGPARLGEDLRAALADMVTHRRIRQAHRVVLIDQPGQDPPRRMALLLGRIQVTAQHGVDRGLERLQPRRDPLRGLARRRNRRFQRLTHGAPVHTVLVGQPPNRQPVDPMTAANRRKLLHPRPHPSASTFVTSGPGYPDADHAEAGPVQAVPTVAACRTVGPNQTVKTTPRHHAGGATSSRPPGANSGCHGQMPLYEGIREVNRDGLNLRATNHLTPARFAHWIDLRKTLEALDAAALDEMHGVTIQTQVLTQVAVAEGFHRRLYPATVSTRRVPKLSSAQRKKVRHAAREAAVATLTGDQFTDHDRGELRHAVSDALAHFNEQTFRSRMQDLVEVAERAVPGIT